MSKEEAQIDLKAELNKMGKLNIESFVQVSDREYIAQRTGYSLHLIKYGEIWLMALKLDGSENMRYGKVPFESPELAFSHLESEIKELK